MTLADLGFTLFVMRQIILPIIQIVLSVLLVTAILLQQRGTGLGAAFGGEGAVYRTKRGLEKGLFYATIGLSVLFFATAILNIALS
ncbi:MAG: preprotein translocase subunit SecG [Parcubacteria group bacterium ADurb.Bin192]|nr:MAG: preprotein translocase subunit SecG [Parcubacteria group bacterium ADurb.Bin192]